GWPLQRLSFIRHESSVWESPLGCPRSRIPSEPESEGGVRRTACPSWPFASATYVAAEKSTVAILNQSPGSTSFTQASSTSNPARKSSTWVADLATLPASSRDSQTRKQQSWE